MIKYALSCQTCAHEFDAWFASSAAYDTQIERGLVSCTHCNSSQVTKAIMAPAVAGTKKTTRRDPKKVFGELAAAARNHIAENFDYVGDRFAAEATAMHYGETPQKPIWGETTEADRTELAANNIAAEPLLPAFTPPKPVEEDKLN